MKFGLFVFGTFLTISAFASEPYIGNWRGYCTPVFSTHSSELESYQFLSRSELKIVTEQFKDLHCSVPGDKAPKTEDVSMEMKSRKGAGYLLHIKGKDNKGPAFQLDGTVKLNQDLMEVGYYHSKEKGKNASGLIKSYYEKQK